MSNFFSRLPAVDQFEALADASSFHPVPGEWAIVCGDVIDSTRAIAEGRYKEVNLLGAALITAVLNLDRALDLPFFFAGDGSCVLVPPELAGPAARVLPGLRRIAQERFDLPLRADVFPVAALRRDGFDTRVARFRYTGTYFQAMFSGEGLTEAERRLKATVEPVIPADAPEPDLTGLECRWRGVPGPRGEVISLLLQAIGLTPDERTTCYRDALDFIRQTCGDGDSLRPTTPTNLRLNLSVRGLDAEARAHHGKLPGWRRNLIAACMVFETSVGGWFMKHRRRALGTDWGRYFDDVIQHTDYRKFDNLLRMVISCTPAQRANLVEWLDAGRSRGRLRYGLHVSSQALLTCVVLDRADRHFHFVDGADGGYAAAAKQMKSNTQK